MSKETVLGLKQALGALIVNEGVTRVRVNMLEALANRKLLGRLKWLLTGK